MRTGLIATVLLVAGCWAAETQADRTARLERSLMAPCCWSQNIAVHDSEIAREMRRQVAAWVAGGRSDAEILGEFKKQYGRRILTEPEGVLHFWLTFVPAAATIAGLAVVLWMLRRWRRAAKPLQT